MKDIQRNAIMPNLISFDMAKQYREVDKDTLLQVGDYVYDAYSGYLFIIVQFYPSRRKFIGQIVEKHANLGPVIKENRCELRTADVYKAHTVMYVNGISQGCRVKVTGVE